MGGKPTSGKNAKHSRGSLHNTLYKCTITYLLAITSTTWSLLSHFIIVCGICAASVRVVG